MKKKLLTNPNSILKAPYEFECGAKNIGQYLYELLFDLWAQGEEFNSKRPFGCSAWQIELCDALVEINAIEGEIERDENGWMLDSDYDQTEAEDKVSDLINHIFSKYFPKE